MTTKSTLPDLPYALAYRHIDDLRAAADYRRHLPRRERKPLLRRTRRALHWLWEGQLALVPPVAEPAPRCTP